MLLVSSKQEIYFKVNPESSTELQEFLFSIGCTWFTKDSTVLLINKKCLHLWNDKELTWVEEKDFPKTGLFIYLDS